VDQGEPGPAVAGDLGDPEVVHAGERGLAHVVVDTHHPIIPSSGDVTMPEHLVEQATLAEALTAPASPSGRMSIQVITPGQGSSGYYPQQVCEAAAGLIAPGTPMYLDHPTESDNVERPERSVRDLAAVFTGNGRWDNSRQAVVAEAQVFGPYRQVIAEMAPYIGVSVRGDGQITEGDLPGGGRGRVIESISSISSVDFVTAAGRGGRVLELLESARIDMASTPNVPVNPAGPTTTQESQEDTMPQIEEARLRELEEASGRVTTLEESVRTAEAERDEARRELAESRAREGAATRARARVVAANATLPAATVDRVVEAATRTIPLTEAGALDEAALDTATDAARTSEETYLAGLAEATGVGRITGNGVTNMHVHVGEGGDVTRDTTRKAIAEAFGRPLKTSQEG
jgi:hypothetical protein